MTLLIRVSRLTCHAQDRMSQRGILPDALALLLAWGRDLPAGAGCVRRSLLLRDAAELLAEDVPLALVEAALRLEAVVGEASDVVTVYARRTPKLRCDRRGTQGGREPHRGRRD